MYKLKRYKLLKLTMRDIYRQMIKKEVTYNLSTGTTVTYP